MNWLDIVILVVWGVVAFWGYSTGLIQMLVLLAVVVFGLALSSRIAEPVGNIFSPITANENIQTIAAFIIIFVVLFIIGAIASALLRTVFRFIPFLGFANHLAGMAIGILIGFVLLSGVLTGLQRFPVGQMERTINTSTLGRFLADNFDVVIRWTRIIPGDWDQKLEQLREDILEKVPYLGHRSPWGPGNLQPGYSQGYPYALAAAPGYTSMPIYASIRTRTYHNAGVKPT